MNIIKIAGGTEVRDHANGIAKVVFIGYPGNSPVYKVTVFEKPLVFPGKLDDYHNYGQEASFVGCNIFSFKKVNEQYLKIKTDSLKVFVDISKHRDYYILQPCMWQEFTEDMARAQINHSEITITKLHFACFNGFGVAVYARCPHGEKLFFATSNHRVLKEIDISSLESRKNKYVSDDGLLIVEDYTKIFINHEEAAEIQSYTLKM